MLIIAQEPSQATEKLRRLLDSFGIQSRVFYTNFETDVDKDTISLASSFIYSSEEDYQGKPLFFNDLSVPLYWELWTLGITTYIFDGQDRRASVIFRDNLKERTVKQVQWFGQGEKVVAVDDYNRYGWRTKQRLLDDQGQGIMDIYFNRNQEEVLLHFVSQGTFLLQTPKGRDRLYASKEELQRAVLEQVLPEDEAVLLMDKALLDVVTEIPKERLAYCANDAHELDEIKEQVSQILLVEDGLLSEKIDGITALSGFVDVEQESFQPEALVMTASQEVEGLSSLVHQFPQVTFHIAALTAMGPKLTDLATRPNVRLYPGISLDKYEDLLSSCSIYLDCNQGEEVWSSSLHALENGQVLFGLKSTVHQEAYKNLSTITDTVEEMEQQLDTLLQQPETYKELVREQARILKLPEKEALEELFKRLEGGTA